MRDQKVKAAIIGHEQRSIRSSQERRFTLRTSP